MKKADVEKKIKSLLMKDIKKRGVVYFSNLMEYYQNNPEISFNKAFPIIKVDKKTKKKVELYIDFSTLTRAEILDICKVVKKEYLFYESAKI